jgi:hypothetical protein
MQRQKSNTGLHNIQTSPESPTPIRLRKKSQQHSPLSPPINARKSSHPASMFSQAPRLIVKTICEYNVTKKDSQQLSFQDGDFFYVISDPSSNQKYYEVINPVAKTRFEHLN